MNAKLKPSTGDYVQTWWDQSASFGFGILYGQVVESGPRTFMVLWESGLRNRVRRPDPRVESAKDQAEARKALAGVKRLD